MLTDFLQREIDLGSFPGCAWAVGSSRGMESEGALGHAVAVPLRIAATPDTIWDCASITKPLVTTALVLQAVAEGKVALDDRFDGHTVRSLLTHTSGLAAWLPLYAYETDYRTTIREHGASYPPGTKVVYSDLNFILLYYLLGEVVGDYVNAARERIFEPLGIAGEAMFRPPAELRPRIAATEWGQRFEAKLAKRSEIAGTRPGLMWGTTNDGNSFHAGGAAGNAGLFATARAVFRIARGWVQGEIAPAALVAEAVRNQTEGLDGARGLGWDLATGSAATSMLSSRAFGHTGFTGTSVWIDPAIDRIFVLLTNRVHPCAAPIAMQKVRGEFHRLAM